MDVTLRTNRLKETTLRFAKNSAGYYSQWVFDQPIIVRQETHAKFAALQKIMHKMITFLAATYDDWQHLMPLSSEVKSVLSHFHGKPHRVGTFRTDFVLDGRGNPRIIEITCRFALNAFFLNAAYERMARNYSEKFNLLPTVNPYEGFFEHFSKWLGGSRAYLLRKSETVTESKIFVDIFRKVGIEIEVLAPEDVEGKLREMDGALIINELTFQEICGMPGHVISALASQNLLNDYRTIFLAHDKRFFSVIYDADFQRSILTGEERALLGEFLIETHAGHMREDVWSAALSSKDEWVIKPTILGRSAQVMAGLVTSESDWRKIISGDRKDLVLQRWIGQRRFHGTVNGKAYDDYLAGTLLYFDEEYLGPAQFRTSSHPVTNVVDDRKAFYITPNDMESVSRMTRIAII